MNSEPNAIHHHLLKYLQYDARNSDVPLFKVCCLYILHGFSCLCRYIGLWSPFTRSLDTLHASTVTNLINVSLLACMHLLFRLSIINIMFLMHPLIFSISPIDPKVCHSVARSCLGRHWYAQTTFGSDLILYYSWILRFWTWCSCNL